MIRYTVHNGFATVTIDDVERRNPLTTEAMHEIREALVEAARDDDVRAVVITGAGDKAFSAGGDLGGGFVDEPLQSHAARGAFAEMLKAVRGADKPVIARVNGHALAGGFGLAVACDIAIAVEAATFGATEIRVGLWPMMISAVLGRAMSRKAVLELMLSGRRMDATEALQIGAISRVVATHSALDAAVERVVANIQELPAGVISLGRSAFFGVDGLPVDASLDVLHAGLTAVAMTDDAAEGVAAFVEKRAPRWSGT